MLFQSTNKCSRATAIVVDHMILWVPTPSLPLMHAGQCSDRRDEAIFTLLKTKGDFSPHWCLAASIVVRRRSQFDSWPTGNGVVTGQQTYPQEQ